MRAVAVLGAGEVRQVDAGALPGEHGQARAVHAAVGFAAPHVGHAEVALRGRNGRVSAATRVGGRRVRGFLVGVGRRGVRRRGVRVVVVIVIVVGGRGLGRGGSVGCGLAFGSCGGVGLTLGFSSGGCLLGGDARGFLTLSFEGGLTLVDEVDGRVLLGGQFLHVGATLSGDDRGLVLGGGRGLVGGVGALLHLVSGGLLVGERGVRGVAGHLGDLLECSDVLHLRLGGGGEGADAGLLGLDAAQSVGVEVGGKRIERAATVTVGSLCDGGDLLLAFLEGSLGSVRVSRRLIGGCGRLLQRNGRFVEVFARDLRVLHRGCGAGVDFGELDLNLGDAHLRGLFGSLGGCDLFLRGGGLRHLG
ncbi:Uncharacterised protein [Mycobacteroides abscessus subsp. abscessus]|nr:Uncharacterised protein [Mycobacteroides abscessus subsp. abscessus]